MATLTIEYPDPTPAQKSREEFEKEVRFWVAVKLFDTERVSLGKAAEMCGMNKIDFMFEVGKLGIPVIRYEIEDVRKEEWNLHKRSS